MVLFAWQQISLPTTCELLVILQQRLAPSYHYRDDRDLIKVMKELGLRFVSIKVVIIFNTGLRVDYTQARRLVRTILFWECLLARSRAIYPKIHQMQIPLGLR